jgi:hypothetical protein
LHDLVMFFHTNLRYQILLLQLVNMHFISVADLQVILLLVMGLLV